MSADFLGLGADHILRQQVKESSLQTAAAIAAIQAILVKKKLTTVKEIEALTAQAAADMDQQAAELAEEMKKREESP